MTLSESQIIRYSRHVLLREVGGTGQVQLLSCGTALVGQGASITTAAAYLAAGGTSIWADTALVSAEDVGFLLEATDVGESQGASLNRAVADLNPDALLHRSGGCIAQAPLPVAGPPPWVLHGQGQERAGIVFRSERGCANCFELSARHLFAPVSSHSAVLVGVLTALVFQRLCLGFSPDLGGLWVRDDGEVASMEMPKCLRCP